MSNRRRERARRVKMRMMGRMRSKVFCLVSFYFLCSLVSVSSNAALQIMKSKFRDGAQAHNVQPQRLIHLATHLLLFHPSQLSRNLIVMSRVETCETMQDVQQVPIIVNWHQFQKDRVNMRLGWMNFISWVAGLWITKLKKRLNSTILDFYTAWWGPKDLRDCGEIRAEI